MPSADAPTVGRVISKVASAPEEPERLSGARALELLLQLLLATEQSVAGHAAVLEHDLGCLRGADPELGLLLAEREAGVVLGDDEGRLAAVAEVRVDGRDDDRDVGDAAVGDEGLGPVENPVFAVALGGRPAATSRPSPPEVR